jgi:hypothetical protein
MLLSALCTSSNLSSLRCYMFCLALLLSWFTPFPLLPLSSLYPPSLILSIYTKYLTFTLYHVLFPLVLGSTILPWQNCKSPFDLPESESELVAGFILSTSLLSWPCNYGIRSNPALLSVLWAYLVTPLLPLSCSSLFT